MNLRRILQIPLQNRSSQAMTEMYENMNIYIYISSSTKHLLTKHKFNNNKDALKTYFYVVQFSDMMDDTIEQ